MKIDNKESINNIDWGKVEGLVPCIIQDAKTSEVLMQGFMNEEALAKTLDEQVVTFFSRTKNRLWTKGETSGNTLELVSICADCDKDSLLVLVNPTGPTCHLRTKTCWVDSEVPILSELGILSETIQERAKNANSEQSYTAKLLQDGIRRCAQKVGEEGVEVALAAVAQEDQALLNESADLLYHLLVVLEGRNLSLSDVLQVLRARRKT